MTKDQQTIKRAGGPAKMAELLGFDKKNGTARVSNWLRRGVPAQIKIDRQDIFGKISGKRSAK